MTKHLILVGGGHAHMMVMSGIDEFVRRGHAVTVIGPSPFHYYSGMGPGMLSGLYVPDEIRFAVREKVERNGGAFLLGRVTAILPLERKIIVDSGDTLSYDVVSFNAGSYVPDDFVQEEAVDIYPVKPIEGLWAARQRLIQLLRTRSVSVGVIGGGAAAVEVAGNLWRLGKDFGAYRPNIHIFVGDGLMGRLPQGFRRRVRRSLDRRGIQITKDYAQAVSRGAVVLASGKSVSVDMVLVASGVRPSSLFKDANLPVGPEGGLRVNRFLQSPAHPQIFGGGDCIYFEDWPLDRVGVYAVRQNPVLLNNLLAALEDRPLMPFYPGKDYLLVLNLGDGTGLLKKKWFVWEGRSAFMLKDYIDRKFMRRFQV